MFEDKIIEVAFSLKGRKKDRGVVIDTESINYDFNPDEGRLLYDKFLERGDYESVRIRTRQGPGELAENLAGKFNITRSICIYGMIASLNATLPEARRVLEDLRNNPKDYYVSSWEEGLKKGDLLNPLVLGYALGKAIKEINLLNQASMPQTGFKLTSN
ncbi:MAG: hypothetical protein ACE5ES_01490 [Candidatus Nanoarchaeia archaeon]